MSLGMDEMQAPQAPSDLGPTGADIWYELMHERKLGATHMSLVHNLCRCADNLDTFAAGYADNLVTRDDMGAEVANPLLVEFRQQLLAMRQILKDLGLMQLDKPESAGGGASKWAKWAEENGIQTR